MSGEATRSLHGASYSESTGIALHTREQRGDKQAGTGRDYSAWITKRSRVGSARLPRPPFAQISTAVLAERTS